jgi:putative transposase
MSCMDVQTLSIRQTYKYRLYRDNRRDKALHQQINVAGMIWNHALRLQRRYYRLFGGYIKLSDMKSHIAKLRRSVARYAYWQDLGSQAVQEVQERLDEAYQKFFHKQAGLPRFKKVKRYKSFVLKQCGWKLLSYNLNKPKPNNRWTRARGEIRIGEVRYKFVKHRPMFGDIKTITIKRDAAGRLWVCFSVIEVIDKPNQADLSHVGGFDFGLYYFLTDHTGKRCMHPLFLRDALNLVQQLNRSLSRKMEGGHNHKQTKWLLARAHIRVADKRRDFHFRLAIELCKNFDVLIFEDLHIAAMKRLWGRKVSDLAFSKFLAILKHVALKQGKVIVTIDRFEPTTQTCSCCGEKQKLSLKVRQFNCSRCDLSLDRDHNAALNILRAGASAHQAQG